MDAETQVRAPWEVQRQAFRRDGPPAYEKRQASLQSLLDLTNANENRIADAISRDFGHRSRFETSAAEVLLVIAEINFAQRHLRSWMKPRSVSTAIQFWPARNQILSQPVGVVGIISPWNYPFSLALLPAVGALAAGNRVILKPSEVTPRTSELLKEMVASNFSPEEFLVVTGGAEVGQAMANTRFDHLFFTGSTATGREVAIAAARNLTPVTLELGGKSPAIIGSDYSIPVAAERIVFGKLLNAGQTCIAPDYVLVPRASLDRFVDAVRVAAAKLYPTIQSNPDYSSIVNNRHWQRLLNYLGDARDRGAKVIEVSPALESEDRAEWKVGGEDGGENGGEDNDPAIRKLPLHLVIDARDEMKVMQEEIFGPILPVIPYDSLEEVIAYINQRPHPLALYWFGKDATLRERVLRQTISGGVTVNDTLWHICQEALPFGGVGPSGMGSYHGIHGFKTFSKQKGVFYQSRWNAGKLLYPPFGKTASIVLRWLKKIV